MFKTRYEYNKPTEYTRPATFGEFLELNNINAQDISGDEFADFAQKLDAATEKVKKAIEEYDQTRENIKCHHMQYIGLVNQSNTHFYTYEAKKGY